ncbi:MAG TPA: aryl-sulfate sulfotransferase [Pirellulales bacterium]
MRLTFERLLSWIAPSAFAAVLTISMLAMGSAHAADDDKKAAGSPESESPKPAAPQAGVVVNEPKAFPGFNLLAPLNSTQTFLLDMQGRVVRTWQSDCSPALCAYLLDNGHILRGGSIGVEAQVFGPGPGVGGRVQEFSWDGEPVWDFRFFNARQLPHHDLTPLPNGNIVMIVWDRKTADEALAAGRRPELTADSHLLVDSLVEIKPTGPTTGDIVWQWHLWDHVVQDFDKSKPNYGNVAEHPELVNLNYGEDALAPIAATKDGADKLKSVGYVGAAAPPGRPRANPDWTHCNGLAYNPELDQIIVSVHAFSEFWIIDHSTTTAEAASHTGGRSGKGGDLLYRWGNPRAYRGGKKEDQKLFAQHNAHWIGKGLPGEGHVLVFNNGGNRSDGSYSSVDELVLPVDAQGRYTLGPGGSYGPDAPVWSYTAPKKTDFYSFFISGAQRLPSGNTLICSGATGVMFEVTPDKEVVWKYVNPVKAGMGSPGGFAAPPAPGQVMTPIIRTFLAILPEQATKLDAVQQEVDDRLAKLLTADQHKQLNEPQAVKMAGLGASFQTGQVLSPAEQDRLKLSDDQKQQLASLQKEVDGKVEAVLTEAQRKQSKIGFAFGGPPPGGPGGPGAPPRLGELLPAPLREGLKLTDDQNRQADDLQKEADARLEKLLTDDQQKQLKDPKNLGALSPPGQLMSPALQARLKLTSDQKKQLRALQGEADKKLAELFSEEQKKQFQQMQANVGGGLAGRPGGPPAGPGGPGGRPGGPPGGPNFPSNPVFRLYRFAPNHLGLADKNLTPGKTIEEMQASEADKAAQTAAGQPARASAATADAK